MIPAFRDDNVNDPAFLRRDVCIGFLDGDVIVGHVVSPFVSQHDEGKALLLYQFPGILDGLPPYIRADRGLLELEEEAYRQVCGQAEDEDRGDNIKYDLYQLHSFLIRAIKKPSIAVSCGNDRKLSLLNRNGSGFSSTNFFSFARL